MILGIISIVIGVILIIANFIKGIETVQQQTVQYIGFLIGSVFIMGGLIIITVKKCAKETENKLSSIEKCLQKPVASISGINPSPTIKSDVTNSWFCKKCGTENSAISNSCKDCGGYR